VFYVLVLVIFLVVVVVVVVKVNARNPIMSSLITAHAACMALAFVAVFPYGIRLARRRSPAHVIVQGTGVGLVVLGLIFAMRAEVVSSASHTTKRHEGAHAWLHSSLGLVLSVAVLTQALIGALVHVEVRGSPPRRYTVTAHRILGYTVLAIALAVQLFTGISAYFELCEEGRTSECVGRAAGSVFLLAAAAAYYAHHMALARWNAGEEPHDKGRDYAVYATENVLLAVAALALVLYSLQSQWPYVRAGFGLAVGLTVFLCSVGGRVAIEMSRRRAQPLHRAVLAGFAFSAGAWLAAILCAVVIAHAENQYAALTMLGFSVSVGSASAARLAQLPHVAAVDLVVAAVFFMGSQEGFAQLWQSNGTSLPGALALHLALAALICVSGWALTLSAAPPRGENELLPPS